MTAIRPIVALCVLSALVSAAVGQYQYGPPNGPYGQQYGYIPQQVQTVQPTGRLFDANPLVGGGGFNYERPVSPLLLGNAAATGQLRQGLSLRVRSPLSDPTLFQGYQGTTSLSTFVRDSVSVADAYRYRTQGYQPFFDPTGTTTTVGGLIGQPTNPLTTLGQRTEVGNFRTQPGLLNYSGPIDARLPDTPASLGRNVPTGPNPEQIASGLFGMSTARTPGDPYSILPGRITQQPGLDPNNPVNLNFPPGRTTYGQPQTPGTLPGRVQDPFGLMRDRPRPQVDDRDLAVRDPLDLRLDGRLDAARPLDQMLNSGVNQILARQAPMARTSPTEPFVSSNQPDAAVPPLAGLPQAGQPGGVAAGLHTGENLFTDLQLALELQRDPRASWFQDLAKSISERPSANVTQAQPERPLPGDDSQQIAEAQAFIDQVMAAPLRSFAGDIETPLNEEISEAETAMHRGDYNDAARAYDRAARLDPANPLPVIGKAHAQLAAGDYRAAAFNLTRGLERYPELAAVPINLTELLGGGEIVDIRRADIARLLEHNEDAQLRFLLGYLEYHTGNERYGWENLQKAASEAGPGSIIRRYPLLLRKPSGGEPMSGRDADATQTSAN